LCARLSYRIVAIKKIARIVPQSCVVTRLTELDAAIRAASYYCTDNTSLTAAASAAAEVIRRSATFFYPHCVLTLTVSLLL